MNTREIKKELHSKAKSLNAKIRWVQKIEARKLYHYWYGGTVTEVEYKGFTFEISAIGDVECDLYKKPINTENNELLATVKDRQNLGRFSDEMSQYIKSDDKLQNAIDDNRLDILYNNWWEISLRDKNGNFIDCEYVADGDLITEAVDECLDEMDDILLNKGLISAQFFLYGYDKDNDYYFLFKKSIDLKYLIEKGQKLAVKLNNGELRRPDNKEPFDWLLIKNIKDETILTILKR